MPGDDDTAPRSPLRVAVIGYGLAGSAFHAPLIAATDGLAVTAVVTGDADRAAAARVRHPDAIVVPRADDVWAMADRLDLAVVATPNRTHLSLGLAALDAGLHVVVDKPLAANVADARRLIDHARARGRILTVYQNRRWDGDFLTLRRLIARGELGEVHRLESRFERWRPELKPGWRQSPAREDAGGLLFDLGSHLIDQALVLFGPVAEVHAEMHSRRPGSRVDDDTFLALLHENGVRSHLWMNVIAARPGPRFRVLGSRGTWIKHGLDIQEARLRDRREPDEPGFGEEPEDRRGVLYYGEQSRPTPSEPGAYIAFYRALERAARHGTSPPVPAGDALAALEIIERARRQVDRIG